MSGFAALLDQMRAGIAPSPADITDLVEGLITGALSDAQTGAFAMAVCCHGLPLEAATALTQAMTASGTSLPRLTDKPRLDKHSTGGLGDATSLVLAPLLAAVGAEVPMISGRALGHTGGTLDKLEALPGLTTDLSLDKITRVLNQCGCVIAASSPEIAPADRRLYAVRDATGTVQSPALITASILSKKLAATLDALILDVKCGSGATLTDAEAARDLAGRLVSGASDAGVPARALITAMDQPLLPCLGSGLEMAACLDVLRGEGQAERFETVVFALAEELCDLAALPITKAQLHGALSSGRAYERFACMAHAMGACADPSARTLAPAPVQRPVYAQRSGQVAAMDGVALGWVAHRLNQGVSGAYGLTAIRPLGHMVTIGEPLCLIHAADDTAAQAAETAIQAAITIGETSAALPLILEVVTR